jgi:hypothetical protein
MSLPPPSSDRSRFRLPRRRKASAPTKSPDWRVTWADGRVDTVEGAQYYEKVTATDGEGVTLTFRGPDDQLIKTLEGAKLQSVVVTSAT